MASTYLTRAFSSSTATTKATWSFWVKFSAVNTGVGGTGSMLFQARNSSSSNNYRTYIRYEENGTLDFICYNSSGTKIGEYYTSKKFRDCNAWYHICYSMDTTLSTASDRLKLYVNGVRVTNFYTGSYTAIGQNETVNTTSSVFTDISRNGGSAGYYFSGILSHYILTDGYVYQADTFGSTDATTGEWKINPSPTISNWGSNGFWILKDGNSVTDSSPNSNTFTVGGGTLTKTEDSPSNVFATLNPLSSLSTFSYGNTEAEFSSGSGYQTTTTTLGMTSGKYYCEAKVTVNGNYPGFGICETNSAHATQLNTANWLGSSGGGIGWYVGTTSGNAIYYNDSGSTAPTSFSTNDIVGMALDLDSAQNTLKYYKNGTLVSTQNISTSSNGWLFGVTHNTNQTPARSKFNFGNGYFRSTAVSSAGTNASNNGIFEYDVPTGYTALSTKGLNT